MIYRCCVCNKELRRTEGGDEESHGYCKGCFLDYVVKWHIATAEEIKEWEQLRNKQAPEFRISKNFGPPSDEKSGRFMAFPVFLLAPGE